MQWRVLRNLFIALTLTFLAAQCALWWKAYKLDCAVENSCVKAQKDASTLEYTVTEARIVSSTTDAQTTCYAKVCIANHKILTNAVT